MPRPCRVFCDRACPERSRRGGDFDFDNRGKTDGCPILNFAFFAKFRVGMLEADPKPATGCDVRWRPSRNRRSESANERREDSLQLPNCPLKPKPSLSAPPVRFLCFLQGAGADGHHPAECFAERPLLECGGTRGSSIAVPKACSNLLAILPS